MKRSNKKVITEQELARLDGIIRRAKQISDEQDQLLTEAYQLTAEIQRNGLTADAVFLGNPASAATLCQMLGIESMPSEG